MKSEDHYGKEERMREGMFGREERRTERERERQAAAREDQAKMNKNPDALANEKVGSYVENGGC